MRAIQNTVPVRGTGIHSATTKIFNAVRRAHSQAPRRRMMEHACVERSDTAAVARAWETEVARLTMHGNTGELILRSGGYHTLSTRAWILSTLSGVFGIRVDGNDGPSWNPQSLAGWERGKLYLHLTSDEGSTLRVTLSKGGSITYDGIKVIFED